jgi:long-chain acyl-CoA synthetase
MISQYNVMYTCASLRMCFAEALVDRPLEGLRVVSYLPMAHIAERMSSHYQGIVFGLDVATCPDPGLIAGYCREIKPESMFGVPRVWEKVYAGVNAALAADPDKAAKFADAIEASKALVAARQRGPLTEQQQQTADFLDTIVFAPVRAMVGLDAALLIVSGAAPIPKEIIEWFQAIGVPVTEIYGLSETSGPMTWEARADYVRPGTVGRAIPGCGVRLADDGEIICRGGNVFVGYFKAPEKTAEVLHDGWFYSGDIGTLDDDGYVRIVDRKKELIITAGGKNISPANLEAALKTIPLVGQACAIGDQRKFVSALLVLDPEYAPVWAGHHGVEFTSLAELAAHPLALAEVEAGVEAANRQFAQVEQIKRFTLLGEEWLPDSDLLTPTSKLKRRGILARYAAEIEAMYG